MTAPEHLAYDELATPADMRADCQQVGRRLHLDRLEQAAVAATGPVPSIHYADFPREIAKPEIQVSEAAARLANALHLHLD